jgi:hypothetical protein
VPTVEVPYVSHDGCCGSVSPPADHLAHRACAPEVDASLVPTRALLVCAEENDTWLGMAVEELGDLGLAFPDIHRERHR